jgi:uncharacterized delta-60 repeat protein
VAVLLAGCALVSAGADWATAAKGGPTTVRVNKAGQLDRSFNGDGKLVTELPTGSGGFGSPTYRLPFEFAAGRIAMAAAGGGKLIVASNKAIVEYLANGRPNPSFGGNGAVPIGGIEGIRFRLADIAVDSQGRLLVAGTSTPTNELGMGGPVAGPLPSTAIIRRYLPNGQLDPSFGTEGVLKTDFSAPPPAFEGSAYPAAAVGVVGITIDQADRPIVTGSAVVEVGLCAPSEARFQRSQAFVARLQAANGVPDPSFAGSGIKTIGGLAWLGLPSAAAAGVISVGAKVDPCPQGGGPEAPSVLTSLMGDGGLNQGFSGGGFWSQPFIRVSDLVVAPSGKLVLLARTLELKRGEWIESAGEAIRLRGNGTFDRSFGRGGRAEIELPKHSSIAGLAIDRKGRVLLAGTIVHQLRHKKRSQQRFLLIRTTVAGEADGDFGRSGRVTTAFGARGNVRASEVLVDRAGRVTVGGKFSGPATGDAFAIARYLGGK